MGVIQKTCHLHNRIFHPIQICQFYSITSPMLFAKLHYEIIQWEKTRFFVYIALSAYHVISKEAESPIFRQNWIFRQTCMYKQPALTKVVES